MKNNGPVTDFEHKFPSDPNAKIISVTDRDGIITEAVSYTHLTLPTIA